jgi:tight adherence protein B
MDALILTASAAAAASVTLVSYGAWAVATGDRTRVAERVTRTGTGIRAPGPTTADVGHQARESSIFTPADRALERFGWADRARRDLARAEISLYVSEFILLRIAFTVVTFLAFALIGGRLLFYMVGAIAAFVVYWQMGAFVRRRISRRLTKIDDQLDGALVNIAGSLRAGFSFLQACQMSVSQLEWPLRDEISQMLEELNLGASLEDALAALASRTDSYEIAITVNAVLVQRQIGGSLADILDNVAKTIRERKELRGHIMALTAQQRLSAIFVAGVPPFMAVVLSLTSWTFMKPLFFTLTGNILMTLGIVLDMVGFLVMRRLTRIDF